MRFPIETLSAAEFPKGLLEIPQPPKTLNYRGQLPPENISLLSIVGSRKHTTYGKEVVEKLVGELAGYPVGIVSGLALGMDSLAHEAALKHDLYTLVIPGGGLDDSVLYPRRHVGLAYRILEAGGGLLSEFDPNFHVTKWSFVQRNRLVAGISAATLLIEAAEKSGTLITARMCVDYNRELLVVPGSIFSKTSAGVHQFLKLGATPVTCGEDILNVLGIEVRDASMSGAPAARPTLTPAEQHVIEHLHEPKSSDELVRLLQRPVTEVSILLMQMEIAGHITESDGRYRVIL